MDRHARQRLLCSVLRSAQFDAHEMAGLCEISFRQLQRYIAADFGCQLHEWLTAQRMISAVQLLPETGSVKQVGLALGFSQTTNFTREFRRVHGLTPSEFLRRWNRRNSAALLPVSAKGSKTCFAD